MDLSDDEVLLKESVGNFATKSYSPASGVTSPSTNFPPNWFANSAPWSHGHPPMMRLTTAAASARVGPPSWPRRLRERNRIAAIFLCNSAPMTVIARYGSDAQKEHWLGRLCRGETIASFGVTEPGGGSDVASVKTRAVEDGDHFVLNGSKIFSTNAGRRFTASRLSLR